MIQHPIQKVLGTWLFDLKIFSSFFTKDSIFENENVNILITLINVGAPGLVNASIVYNLYRGDNIIWTDEENVSIVGQKAYNKTTAI